MWRLRLHCRGAARRSCPDVSFRFHRSAARHSLARSIGTSLRLRLNSRQYGAPLQPQGTDWHRGNYKQHSNAVEATLPDGTKQLIFQTTAPGFATEDAMRELVAWYHADTAAHPLVKCALFCYDFVSIGFAFLRFTRFRDGNGRLSRLLATLLLRQNGYVWIQYVSLKHEIESRKTAYYRELQKCQAQRPGENISSWITFFFDALLKVQQQLLQQLTVREAESQSSPRGKSSAGLLSATTLAANRA